jgi:hypothetical protein
MKMFNAFEDWMRNRHVYTQEIIGVALLAATPVLLLVILGKMAHEKLTAPRVPRWQSRAEPVQDVQAEKNEAVDYGDDYQAWVKGGRRGSVTL